MLGCQRHSHKPDVSSGFILSSLIWVYSINNRKRGEEKEERREEKRREARHH